MEWLEFSDVIGIVIVVYVSVLAHNNPHLKKEVKAGVLFSGLALGILYAFDMSWYVMIYKMPISPRTDFWLNFVTCMVYLMLPLSLSTFFTIYVNKRRKVRHYIGLFTIFILAMMDIINIFRPILFYHRDSHMFFLPLAFGMHVLCFVAFMILLIDMMVKMTFDYEDIILAAFVGITMFIGLMASWVNYDLKTLWIGLGISYLLMYLAVSELYNKKDVMTDLPNRNAFEKAAAHIGNRFSAIMMIDLNSLKKYNDTMGHATGDSYIYATARTLSDAFKGKGKLYRVGGDEFCLVSQTSPDELGQVTEDLLKRGKCSEKYGDFPLDFAYGIGIRADDESFSDVYKKADQLMYEHKVKSKQDKH